MGSARFCYCDSFARTLRERGGGGICYARRVSTSAIEVSVWCKDGYLLAHKNGQNKGAKVKKGAELATPERSL